MNSTDETNPILPAPGVSRNSAINSEASRPMERLNDDVAPNRSQRRAASENSERLTALLRCKKTLSIGTYNANTLREENRALELAQCSQRQGIGILGIQEHRLIHNDPIEFRKIGTSNLVTSSGWRNAAQASQGGVGLLLDHKARKALLKVKSISKRIMTAEFDGNPKTSIIVVYAPTNNSEEEETEGFYNELRNTLQDIPAHNFLALIGDLNARLGPSDAPYTLHNQTNRNGEYLADLLLEFGLIAANTQFRKRPGKLWTFRDRATDSLRQLDYIIVRRKWRNSVQNAEAYSTFSTVGSDHRVVGARIRLSLRTSKVTKKIKYDWKQFSSDSELQEKYTVLVKNKFQVLAGESNGTKYEKFAQANKETMEECLPQKPKVRKSLRSSDNRVIAARLKAQEMQRQHETTKAESDKAAWSQALKDLYEVYRQAGEEELEEQISNIETAHGSQKYGEAWRTVNNITGRKKAKEGQVTGSSPEERMNTWFTHFKNLLGNPPTVEEPDEVIPDVFVDLNINDDPFSIEEYKKVKSSLKLGKAAGPDNIPPEVFKSCDFDNICLDFCNDTLIKNDKPEMWSFMNIVPVPKSGDLTKTDNYRGISLICIIAKMFNRLILNRIRREIDQRLRINQNGFRPKRTTVAQILTLRRIIEGVKEYNLKAVMTFIDFKKAFDSIHRDKMMRILKAYGIPPKLLQAIKQMYTNTKARIISPDGETEMFEITAGVLQGDTLAPFLFVIVLDYAMRKALAGKEEDLGFTLTPRRSRRHPKEVLTDLDFADDIALLSDEIVQAQEILLNVEKECNKVGLGLNARKTKSLTFNIDNPKPLHTAAGTELEIEDDFKYLGSWVQSTEKDIKVRKAQAWKALHDMSRIWKSSMDRDLKIRFFIATIESILLYGCESWTLTETQEKSLNGTYTKMLRVAVNTHWSSHTPNTELYGNLPAVSDKIACRRLQLAGHCHRHPELSTQPLVLWEPKHGVRGRGRPRTNFVDSLKRDTGASDAKELAALMESRKVWRSILVDRLRSTK
jgi:hypothetical protein